jgi:hypothetical protein
VRLSWDARLRRGERALQSLLPVQGFASLIEIHELAVEAKLVKITTGCLDPYRRGNATRLQRIETGSADQIFDRVRCHVIICRIEEHCPSWLAVCRAPRTAMATGRVPGTEVTPAVISDDTALSIG